MQLRRFGSYSLQAVDPVQLIRELSDRNPRFTVGEMSEQLRNLIVNRLADLLGEWPRPILNLAAEFNELGRILRLRLAERWAAYGLELTSLLIENLSLPWGGGCPRPAHRHRPHRRPGSLPHLPVGHRTGEGG